MLCEKCQKREATIHVTVNYAGSTQGEPSPSELCDECFGSSKLPGATGWRHAWQSGCRYCGGEPYTGSGASFPNLNYTHKVSFMCKSCAEEHFGFLRTKWPGFGDPTITDEQLARFRTMDTAAIFRETEEHMQKWVAERESK